MSLVVTRICFVSLSLKHVVKCSFIQIGVCSSIFLISMTTRYHCFFPKDSMEKWLRLSFSSFLLLKSLLRWPKNCPGKVPIGTITSFSHGLLTTHEFFLRAKYEHIAGTKGFHREWINPEYLEPFTVIIQLITYEGKYTIFKSCHLILLVHFLNNQALNFPFYFLKSP